MYIYYFNISCATLGISIITNSKKIIDLLPSIFSNHLSKSQIEIRYINVKIISTGETFSVEINNRIRNHIELNEVLIILSQVLHAIETDSDWLILHGFVIGLPNSNSSLALVAPSKSGKSTLGTYLVHNGYIYISDDILIVNIKTREIIPFNRPIHLRKPSIFILQNSLQNFDTTNIHLISDRYNYKIDTSEISRKYYIQKLLFINYGSTEHFEPLNTHIARDMMIHNLYSPKQIKDNIVKCATFSQTINSFKINYDNMNYVKKILQSKQFNSIIS